MSPYGAMGLLRVLSRLGGKNGNKLRVQKVQVLPPKASRYDTHVDKMAEVAIIEDELQEKHSGKYTDQQLRSWAHLIQMKKHSSYDEPPDKPFFHSSHKSANTPASAVSPGCRPVAQIS